MDRSRELQLDKKATAESQKFVEVRGAGSTSKRQFSKKN
jgi:post-segregation antitoxin (ccd killing protein)